MSQTHLDSDKCVQEIHLNQKENGNNNQIEEKQVPFWLINCQASSSKQVLSHKNIAEPNPEQSQNHQSYQGQEQVSFPSKQIDLIDVEENSNFDSKITSVQNKQNENIQNQAVTPQKHAQALDDIFLDLIVPSERSINQNQKKYDLQTQEYAINQWNCVMSTQQIISLNKQNKESEEIKAEQNEKVAIQKEWSDSNWNSNGQKQIEQQINGQAFFDLNEFSQQFNGLKETNDFNEQNVKLVENIKSDVNNTNQIQQQSQQFQDKNQFDIDEKDQFDIDDKNEQGFTLITKNQNKGLIESNDNAQNLNEEMYMNENFNNMIETIDEQEFEQKQQSRYKQRYYSEYTHVDNALLQPTQGLYDICDNINENENDSKQLNQKQKKIQLIHNSSSKDMFQSAQNGFKNNRLSHNPQIQLNVPDPLDFYSHRPPTGYFTLKRGVTGVSQVVDLLQEANILKEEQKKQLKRDQFMIEFNTDPNSAIQKLEQDQKLSLQNIAEFLLKAEGIRKNTLGQFFGKETQKNQDILREFCKIIDFNNQTIDEALRSLMSKFRLPGESQQIDRIMCAFSESYHEQNPNTFENSDIVYILAYSIIMLHTDIHSDKIEKKDKMKKQDYVERTINVTKSKSVTFKVLSDIYDRIQAKQFECEQDAFEKAYDILLISHADNQTDFAKLLNKDVKMFQSGSLFLKYGRSGSPKEKFVNLSESGDKIQWCDPKNKSKKREILIDDIYEITIGSDKTEVLKKNKVPKQFDNLCFSLLVIGHDNGKRSLDLKAKDEDQRNKWVRFCYQRLLFAKQQAFEIKKAKFSMQEYKEEIAGIWKSQIFEQFDKFWDYEKNLPLNMDKFYKFKSKSKENSKNLWKNVMKKKKQQTQRYSQVGIFNESEMIREHIEDLQKDKEILFIRLWKQGLPHFVRKTLYKLSIGNSLQITHQYYLIVKQQADQIIFKQTNNNVVFAQSEVRQSGFGSPRMREYSLFDKIQQMEADMLEFLEKNPIFKPNQEMIQNVLKYTLYVRQDLNYINYMINIAALIVNVFQNESDSFIYFINLIYSYHFKPLFSGDKIKIEFYNQFFYQSFQKEMKDLHERFIGLNLGPQNYLYSWMLSLFSNYFQDVNIVYRILDNVLIEGEYYIFKAALGIIKMFEIDLRFSSFTIAFKFLTETSKNVNEEFLFDTIECIDINKQDYEKFFTDLKKSQAKSLIHEILVEL
ncbi:hypothetical protein ABPG74_010918 [Tetrahymena malaccensis]